MWQLDEIPGNQYFKEVRTAKKTPEEGRFTINGKKYKGVIYSHYDCRIKHAMIYEDEPNNLGQRRFFRHTMDGSRKSLRTELEEHLKASISQL